MVSRYYDDDDLDSDDAADLCEDHRHNREGYDDHLRKRPRRRAFHGPITSREPKSESDSDFDSSNSNTARRINQMGGLGRAAEEMFINGPARKAEGAQIEIAGVGAPVHHPPLYYQRYCFTNTFIGDNSKQQDPTTAGVGPSVSALGTTMGDTLIWTTRMMNVSLVKKKVVMDMTYRSGDIVARMQTALLPSPGPILMDPRPRETTKAAVSALAVRTTMRVLARREAMIAVMVMA
ncbi:MAG: hypothetical protein ASARMPREDX12_008062 [Alectoria sarmentosa]|nr:MAG: hypothetical protein ASARMPREDX12_008062 [Alectoria sarmentosa]